MAIEARPVVVAVTGISEYQSRLIAGMRDVFDGHGVPVLPVINEQVASAQASPLLLDLIRQRIPLGVVQLAPLAVAPGRELQTELVRLGIPSVAISTDVPGAPCVRGDNVAGMRALMAHLLGERGVRRLVVVRGTPHQPDSIARETVVREAVDSVRDGELIVLDGDFRNDVAYAAMRELLARGADFDAVVAFNDVSALGAMGALLEAGVRVPEDVLVAGFDNTKASELNWPALTTVDQDLEGQGAQAARMLLAQVHDPAPQDDVVVPSRLVVRSSTVPMDPVAPDPREQLREATRAAQSSQAWLAAQEGVIGLNRALIDCRSVADVVTAVSSRLAGLGIRRCFLALSEDGRRSRLVLACRNGQDGPPPDESFEREALLPPSLRSELESGVLVLQPLATAGRDRGHLLFEPVEGFVTLTEVFMIDLSRALDSIFSTEELQQHANRLESLVDQRTRQLQQANAELQRSVIRDGLTGIANRTAFEQQLDAIRHGRDEVALLMVDVDAFKAFNDRYGHLVGDQALKVVASCLEQAVREPEDLACRYGGEEFAVILPRTGRAGALAVAARFRDLLADAGIRHETSPVSDVVTASVGIAVVAEPFESEALITSADQALYRAKLAGRDRVVLASPQGDAGVAAARR